MMALTPVTPLEVLAGLALAGAFGFAAVLGLLLYVLLDEVRANRRARRQ